MGSSADKGVLRSSTLQKKGEKLGIMISLVPFLSFLDLVRLFNVLLLIKIHIFQQFKVH